MNGEPIPELKPGEVLIDAFLVGNSDDNHELIRTIDTCEGTWGKRFKFGKCHVIDFAAFSGIFVSAGGIAILEPHPVQRGPANREVLRGLQKDFQGRRREFLSR